jgi:redox-sensitive bicupin YhaK (pirin superfamily)
VRLPFFPSSFCVILTLHRSYYDNEHSQFGSLRVINEDRVAPKTGFGTHAHREFEIFSYIVDGELEQ